MSKNVSLSVPYNYDALMRGAEMLKGIAESLAPTKNVVLTEADALADLNGGPRPDNPSLEATLMQNQELREEIGALKATQVFAHEPSIKMEANAAVELDGAGLPWDARIHASTKTKDVNGYWKYLRGVDRDVLVPQVEAELRSFMDNGDAMGEINPSTGEFKTTAPVTVTATVDVPVTVTPPPPPTTVVTPSISVTTFAQLLQAITQHSIPEDEIKEALVKVNVTNLALLGARADLIPVVAGHLGL